MQTLTLKSNSLTADDNHAGVFKINYNNQLDFTGRKVALINASLTKAQANISNEKLTITQEVFRPGPGPKVADENEMKLDLPWEDHASYLNRFAKNIMNGGKIMVRMATDFSESSKVLAIFCRNKTDFDAYIVLKSYPGTNSCWLLSECVASRQNLNIDLIPKIEIAASNGIPAHDEYTITMKSDESVKLLISMQGMDMTSISGVSAYAALSTKPYLRVDYFPTANISVPTLQHFQPGPGHFPSIKSLLTKVNKLLAKFGKFSFINGRVLFAAKTTGSSFKLNFGGLRMHFGFDELELVYNKGSKSKFLAARPPDLTRGTLHFHVYCSLIQDVYVNEQKRPLIASLDATKSEYGKQHIFNVVTPIYLNCVEGPQAFIEVTIANDSGSIDGLLMGETQLVFAFRD
jgi:hypothetical protein